MKNEKENQNYFERLKGELILRGIVRENKEASKATPEDFYIAANEITAMQLGML